VLRDNSYQHFLDINESIHGAGDNCGVCGTEPKDTRNLQREHDHVTGRARGLACWRCNRLMPKQFDLVQARAIVAYLERVETFYATQEDDE
jgi:phenylalanine-4-hydroxylase